MNNKFNDVDFLTGRKMHRNHHRTGTRYSATRSHGHRHRARAQHLKWGVNFGKPPPPSFHSKSKLTGKQAIGRNDCDGYTKVLRKRELQRAHFANPFLDPKRGRITLEPHLNIFGYNVNAPSGCGIFANTKSGGCVKLKSKSSPMRSATDREDAKQKEIVNILPSVFSVDDADFDSNYQNNPKSSIMKIENKNPLNTKFDSKLDFATSQVFAASTPAAAFDHAVTDSNFQNDSISPIMKIKNKSLLNTRIDSKLDFSTSQVFAASTSSAAFDDVGSNSNYRNDPIMKIENRNQSNARIESKVNFAIPPVFAASTSTAAAFNHADSDWNHRNDSILSIMKMEKRNQLNSRIESKVNFATPPVFAASTSAAAAAFDDAASDWNYRNDSILPIMKIENKTPLTTLIEMMPDLSPSPILNTISNDDRNSKHTLPANDISPQISVPSTSSSCDWNSVEFNFDEQSTDSSSWQQSESYFDDNDRNHDRNHHRENYNKKHMKPQFDATTTQPNVLRQNLMKLCGMISFNEYQRVRQKIKSFSANPDQFDV